MNRTGFSFLLLMLIFMPYRAMALDQVSRGLFVTVLQEPQVLSNRTEIKKLINFAKRAHIKILFVQIYRANKAWFPSKVADSGPYEACLKNVSSNSFEFLIKEAHKEGIEVHAWLNLLSLSNNKTAVLLKKYGPEILTRNLEKKNKIEDYKIDNQYFLEPGDFRVRQALVVLVEEILRAYPELDGIQFDYIRYPDKHPAYGYTKANIERFKKTTGEKSVKEGSLVWQNWKRMQVTELLAQLVKKARSIRSDIKISTTGCAPFVRAYYEAYQDWPFWIRSKLVDFVTVMTYSDNPKLFKEYVLEAKQKVSDLKRINFTIGAYHLGNSPKSFAEEFKFCEESGISTCVILHYGSLLKNPALADFLMDTNKKRHELTKADTDFNN